MHPVLSLIVGLGLAAIGGELFVRGVVGIAAWARIPAGIVGATVAAFATSSPELSVAVNAATAGVTGIAFGDALGSNVVNIGLVLGIVLLLGPIKESGERLRRDYLVALLAPVLTWVLVLDGELSRLDAVLLLSLFVAWILLTTKQALKERDATVETLGERVKRVALLQSLLGLVALVAAGGFIVDGAKFVGGLLGWSPLVVGATLVALGTSMPELATAVLSRLRGHDEVGLGTVLGSNIFNNLFIVGVATSIQPFRVSTLSSSVALGAGLLVLGACAPSREGVIPKWRGWALLVLYSGYVALLIASATTNGPAGP
ncbi:MAG: calcium/sodium antiporter [Fimbriimonadaceae bacterium]|nr:MAG: calcium/sodium antiporter [Fimbriimonadaceae bacterium]